MSAKILVFDSGLGGLTVYAEVAKLRPDAELVYVADDEGFPYGRWLAPELTRHVVELFASFLSRMSPDVAVIACNTASTLVLPDLRARFPKLPFVGTVPAIKPAAAQSRSKRISVLATPGTVTRDYTRALIEAFAVDSKVTLVGCEHLAGLAEAAMNGAPVDDAAIAAEIGPAFVEDEGGRTDCIVLACTHYPLLRDRLAGLAPWPVHWIDPAPAIARRVDAVLVERGLSRRTAPDSSSPEPGAAMFTSGRPMEPGLRAVLDRYRLAGSLTHA
jgi:glutamate racemase